MAKFKTETGEVEIPLIFNDPQITEEMKKYRAIVEQHLGESDVVLVGFAEAPDGSWLGVLRKKDKDA